MPDVPVYLTQFGDYAPDFRSNIRDTPLFATGEYIRHRQRCSAVQLMGDSRHLSLVDIQEEVTHILCGLLRKYSICFRFSWTTRAEHNYIIPYQPSIHLK